MSLLCLYCVVVVSCRCRVITAPKCDNGLDKTLPAEVFTKLGSAATVGVYGGFCNLVGNIPDTIGLIPSLRVVNLAVNQLNGTIPASLPMIPSLEMLVLTQNQLSGEIPASISNATFLEYLSFTYNLLEGEIPAAVFKILDNNLGELKIHSNHLTGNITVDNIHLPLISNLLKFPNPLY